MLLPCKLVIICFWMCRSKAKVAQEAHEAIRPTKPETLPRDLETSAAHQRLYDLILRRTLASEMHKSRTRQVWPACLTSRLHIADEIEHPAGPILMGNSRTIRDLATALETRSEVDVQLLLPPVWPGPTL